MKTMNCRSGCGACCIAPSITGPIPGMPNGKPAGVRCIHLDEDFSCRLYGTSERPDVCSRFQAEPETCGDNREQAIKWLAGLERMTAL